MKFQKPTPAAVAGAKPGFSPATADPRLPSQRRTPRGRRRADPLADVWEPEVVAMLEAAPGLRPIAILTLEAEGLVALLGTGVLV
jgi:hypothetical protein